MPPFPLWWTWELLFTGHARLRMEQRGISETDVRVIIERATGFGRSVVEGRFTIRSRYRNRSWIVIVEPDVEMELLVVVTVYEVLA